MLGETERKSYFQEGKNHVQARFAHDSICSLRDRQPTVSSGGSGGVTTKPNNTRETVIGAILAAAAVAICALIDHFTKEEDP